MWTLVFINLMFNAQSQQVEPVIDAWYEYESMIDCFLDREVLIQNYNKQTGHWSDYYLPAGVQAVCIQQKED